MTAEPAATLITAHVWRPPNHAKLLRLKQPRQPWEPCEFMNCGRPRAEHARAVGHRLVKR